MKAKTSCSEPVFLVKYLGINLQIKIGIINEFSTLAKAFFDVLGKE